MFSAGNKSQVVVITGASAGVGRATAIEFAAHGARIGLIARGKEGLTGAQRSVEEAGGEALVLHADVADAVEVDEAAATAEKNIGPIDIWINNAMTSVFSPVGEMTAEEFRRVTEVTYLGYVHGTMAALKRMTPRNRGMIIQVGSALAYRSIPLQAAYCGAKHAIRGFTDALRSELIHDGSNIRIVAVHLPAINTPQFQWVKSRLPNKAQPVPPIYQPEVAAQAIYWASQSQRREVFVAMSTVKAIFGNKLASRWLDYHLAEEAYAGQQTEEPRDPDQPTNLWEPVSGDHGAHGAFDDRARHFSPHFWLNKHRRSLVIGASSLAGSLAYYLLKRRR